MIGQVILGASVTRETTEGGGKDKQGKEGDVGHIQRWDLSTGIALGGSQREYYAATSGPCSVCLFPPKMALETQALVALNGKKAAVNYYLVDKERPVHRFFGQDRLSALCLSPCGGRLVAGNEEGKLMVWDVASGEMLGAVEDAHFQWISVVRMSADGGYVASGSWDGTVKLWSMTELCGGWKKGEALLTCSEATDKVNDCWMGFGVGRNSRMVTASDDGKVRMYDLVDGLLLATFVLPCRIARVMLNCSETLVVAAGEDGVVYLVDLAADPREIAEQVAISHEDKLEGRRQYSLVGHQGSVVALCFSLDEEDVISGDAKGQIIVWHLRTRQIMRRISADGVLRWLGIVSKDSYESALAGGFGLVVGQPQRALSDNRSGLVPVSAGCDGRVIRSEGVVDASVQLRSTYGKLLDHVFAPFI